MSDVIRVANIENYTIEFINGDLIFTPKKSNITEEELTKELITHSSIVECVINTQKGEVISKFQKNYRPILIDIWKSMPAQEILQTTSFNIKLTNENDFNGYKWYPEINMSVQAKDHHETLKEIIKLVKINNYSLSLSLKLSNNKISRINIQQSY
jgi:hypothetical protein